MKKQVTALILAIVMIFALLPASALPASAATYSGACGKNLTWTLNTSTGLLEISGTGDMKNYDYNFPSPWNDYNNSIKTVKLNDGVTSIGNNAFSSCTNLKSVTISDSVTTIGTMAFSYCIALASIAIPDSVTSIGGGVFRGCTELREIAVHVDNENYCSVIGALYNKDKTELICCPAGLMGSFSVPDGVTSIGTSAFGFCNLSSISLPDGLKSIGWGAFEYCDKLTSIEIPNSVTSVDDSAFFMCSALASANIPSGLKSVGGSMFAGCALTSITIPEGVTSIGGNAFQGCPLTSVTLPNSLTSIETWAFSDCNALKDVYYAGTKAEWKKISIGSNNECLTTAKTHYLNEPVTPPPSFTDVPDNAWFAGAVEFVVENGLMNGVGNNKFSPDTPVTRAMLVTVLWRYDGEPKEGYNTFTDVRNGEWYTDAIAWASKNGVVNGYGGGKFGPNDSLTREQMASIIMRYTNLKGKKTNTLKDISSFSDASKVSKWAKVSVQWAVGFGLINGKSSGNKTLLDPQGKATRAEIATILMRYIQRQNELKPLNDQNNCYHNWVVSNETATCTKDGETIYYCTECAGTKSTAKAAYGHDYVKTVAAATCTTGGYTQYTCQRCGNSYKENQTQPLGHDFSYGFGYCKRCNTAGDFVFAQDGTMKIIPKSDVAAYQKVGWYTADGFAGLIKSKKVTESNCYAAIKNIGFEEYLAESYTKPQYAAQIANVKAKICSAWQQYLNGGRPIVIIPSSVKNYYGTKRAWFHIINLTGKTVTRFDMVFYCYDAYWNAVPRYGYGSNKFEAWLDYTLKPYSLDDYYWDLYGYDSCNQVGGVSLTKVAYSDGTFWYK